MSLTPFSHAVAVETRQASVPCTDIGVQQTRQMAGGERS
jgi:hypothetical protein